MKKNNSLNGCFIPFTKEITCCLSHIKKKTKLTQYVPFSGNSIALHLDVLEAMLRTPMCLTKQT